MDELAVAPKVALPPCARKPWVYEEAGHGHLKHVQVRKKHEKDSDVFLVLTPLLLMLLASPCLFFMLHRAFCYALQASTMLSVFSSAEGVSFYAAQLSPVMFGICVWGLPWAPA